MNRPVSRILGTLAASSAVLLNGSLIESVSPALAAPQLPHGCPTTEFQIALNATRQARAARSWAKSCGIEVELVSPHAVGDGGACTVNLTVRHDPNQGLGTTTMEDRWEGDCNGYRLKGRIMGSVPDSIIESGNTSVQAASHQVHSWIDGLNAIDMELFGSDLWTYWEYDGTKVTSADAWWAPNPKYWSLLRENGQEGYSSESHDTYFAHYSADFRIDTWPPAEGYTELYQWVYGDGNYGCDFVHTWWNAHWYLNLHYRAGCGLDW